MGSRGPQHVVCAGAAGYFSAGLLATESAFGAERAVHEPPLPWSNARGQAVEAIVHGKRFYMAKKTPEEKTTAK